MVRRPILAANCYKHSVGHPFVYSRDDLSYVKNFLNMMFSVPNHHYDPPASAVRALDILMILHADHEQPDQDDGTPQDPSAHVGAPGWVEAP